MADRDNHHFFVEKELARVECRPLTLRRVRECRITIENLQLVVDFRVALPAEGSKYFHGLV